MCLRGMCSSLYFQVTPHFTDGLPRDRDEHGHLTCSRSWVLRDSWGETGSLFTCSVLRPWWLRSAPWACVWFKLALAEWSGSLQRNPGLKIMPVMKACATRKLMAEPPCSFLHKLFISRVVKLRKWSKQNWASTLKGYLKCGVIPVFINDELSPKWLSCLEMSQSAKYLQNRNPEGNFAAVFKVMHCSAFYIIKFH